MTPSNNNATDTQWPDASEMPPPIATVPEIAKFLRVAPNTVYGMIRRKEIPGAKRVGRTLRFSTHIVLEWLTQRQARKYRG